MVSSNRNDLASTSTISNLHLVGRNLWKVVVVHSITGMLQQRLMPMFWNAVVEGGCLFALGFSKELK